MAYTVQIPPQVTIAGFTGNEIVPNKQVSIQGDSLCLTVYAQMVDSTTEEVVVAPVPFNAQVNKNRADFKDILKSQLIAAIKEWKLKATEELSIRENTLAGLETELEVAV